MKLLYPDYKRCLVNLSNSILKHFEADYYHSSLEEIDNILNSYNYKNVVLILNDGLGSSILDKHLSKGSFLIKHKLTDITSVFPATTTASTTSVTSGLTPIEHGWLGWYLYIKDIDKTIVTYLNTLKDTEIKAADYNIAKTLMPYKSIFTNINEKDKYKAYGVSPYEDINYEFSKPDDMYEKIANLCRLEGKKFIYCYYNEPDNLMHDLGVNHSLVTSKIEYINNKIETMCSNLEDTLVIVTADHGLIDAEYIYLNEYPTIYDTLLRETSIEPRSTTFFIKEDKKDIFVSEFNKHFSEHFILLTKEEVINKELFGFGIENIRFKDCLGDFLAIAISNKSLVDKVPLNPLKGMHAGITIDEVLVPLIVIEKRK
jgi:predicted AlkP superfamily pyrophosphatase or phosphodiesterase